MSAPSILVGTTYAGRVVHRGYRPSSGRVTARSCCQSHPLRARFVLTLAEASEHWPLCERCFTPAERLAVTRAHNGLAEAGS